MTLPPVLNVEDLHISFSENGMEKEVVKGISFAVNRGEIVAIVGESGAGKSVAAQSVLRLLPVSGTRIQGAISLGDRNILELPEKEMRSMRGKSAGMIFQEPMTALNPLHTIEKQITEGILSHDSSGRKKARQKAIELLSAVGIDHAEERLGHHPHQLSGGQRQRVMIAMAIASNPGLLIADEPTTALDVTVQARVLALLSELKETRHMGILLITHDLGVVRHVANRVYVMRGGEFVETATPEELFEAPRHPYTKQLVTAHATPAEPRNMEGAPVVLKADDIRVHFQKGDRFLFKKRRVTRAVDGVSLEVKAGESLGIVGESGSGKSTLALALLRLIRCRGGIEFMGHRLDTLGQAELNRIRQNIQVVFQDPFASLSPRMSVREIVAEGLSHHAKETRGDHHRLIEKAITEVGLSPSILARYPHEFSGGERQRIAIARALVLNPALIILDEPTSALDRSIQFQVTTLLKSLQKTRNIAYLFISHDLRIIRSLCDRVMVMKDGQIVESGNTHQIFETPAHPYTKELLAAALS
ncbi:ABC transporter ATP-binding protein [Desulfoluna spongiiphila]|uniref:Microcin C transport system ATP-binding protein n=1 Tax=Desulfoluna spongiiphila TaxID=419481 RepID=A0A1G5EPB1_9BACT|nr:dipeptide ABC transporter ATP-binding protein [Desulfoluna spongiiphila]SCY28809.1 microcin C transport system ATP-binding protein [Desulfoluna spongiiphila]